MNDNEDMFFVYSELVVIKRVMSFHFLFSNIFSEGQRFNFKRLTLLEEIKISSFQMVCYSSTLSHKLHSK